MLNLTSYLWKPCGNPGTPLMTRKSFICPFLELNTHLVYLLVQTMTHVTAQMTAQQELKTLDDHCLLDFKVTVPVTIELP